MPSMPPLLHLPKAFHRWRSTWLDQSQNRWVRLFAWIDLYILDHGFLRPFFNRPQQIAPGVWRSHQPSPRTLRQMHRHHQLKAVLNLRGDGSTGYYMLEKEACHQLGIQLISERVYSRAAPNPEKIGRLKAIFSEIPKPFLLHCKSGADRAGITAALFMLLETDAPPEVALKQLSFRYLHIKQAKTGVLDAVLEQYLEHYRQDPMPFMSWVNEHYDHRAIEAQFKMKTWATWLVDGLLRRE